MSVVGSLIFCTNCGNLLDSISHQKVLKCQVCNKSYPTSEFANLKVVTHPSKNAFPSALRAKQSLVKTTLHQNEIEEGATIHEKCPQCGNDEMQYHTLQLRSADEGATVFYTCKRCGYRFRTNNWAYVQSAEKETTDGGQKKRWWRTKETTSGGQKKDDSHRLRMYINLLYIRHPNSKDRTLAPANIY